jgi:hypothetical protein
MTKRKWITIVTTKGVKSIGYIVFQESGWRGDILNYHILLYVLVILYFVRFSLYMLELDELLSQDNCTSKEKEHVLQLCKDGE